MAKNNKFERVSPGVYKDGKGRVVKAPGGKAPTGGSANSQGDTTRQYPDERPRNDIPRNPRIRNKSIGNQNRALGSQGGNLANQILDTSQFASGEAFNPELAQRTITSGFGDERNQIEQAVYGNLTRGLDEQYGNERQMMQDELINSGNPVGSPKYEAQMKAFNDRYDQQRAQARNQATQFGGQEQERAFGIQEGVIGNQLSQGESIRNQQLGEIGGLSQLGMPQIATLEDIALKKKQLRQAMAALGGGGGGGGGQQAPSAPAPVFSPTPYGYG